MIVVSVKVVGNNKRVFFFKIAAYFFQLVNSLCFDEIRDASRQMALLPKRRLTMTGDHVICNLSETMSNMTVHNEIWWTDLSPPFTDILI